MIEAESRIDVIIDDTELRDGANRVRLLNNTDPVDGPVRVLFDDHHVKAALPECDRRGQAADPTTDYQYGKMFHGTRQPPNIRPTCQRLEVSRESVKTIVFMPIYLLRKYFTD